MGDFPRFEYNMHQVKRAGEALKGELLWRDERRDELIEIFRIANNWRDTHAYPMVRVRHETLGKMRSTRVDGITAARLKRLTSIRKKLARFPTSKLDQMQDLGGCRAILCSMADVRLLTSALRDGSKHLFRNESDYIAKPKRGGYARDDTHLCVFAFRGIDYAYFRREYSAGRVTTLMKELSSRVGLMSLWRTRSGSGPTPKSELLTGRTEQEILTDLSNELFWPAMRGSLDGLERLSIVPIDEMSSIPLSALQPRGDGRPAVELFSINILAFLADIQKGPTSWPQPVKSALVIGNPRPSNDAEYSWVSLPGAEDEARKVHETFGGSLLLRQKATKKNVLAAATTADLMHFAAHGFSDEEQPLDKSFLMLSDSRLTAREVQSLRLTANPIVVLSACQTGEGLIMEAGIVGIARAFQIAGASNTVMSLWAVDDAATAALMAEFDLSLKSYSPADAMRRAMLSTRKTVSAVRWFVGCCNRNSARQYP